MDLTNEDNKEMLTSKSDLAVELMSVDRILGQTIEKLKITLLMPRIIVEAKTAIGRLNKTEFKICADMLKAFALNGQRLQEAELRWHGPPYEDQELVRLIDIFQENYRTVIYFNDWLNEMSQAEKASIIRVGVLQKIAQKRFNASAVAQLDEEQKLSVVYEDFLKTLRHLDNMDKIIQANRKQFHWKSISRRSTFHNESLKINDEIMTAKKYRDKAADEFIERLNPRLNAERKKRVKDDLETTQLQLEATIKNNIVRENAARSERNKWLIQLQSLNKKYDQSMLEKFREKIYVEQLCEDAKAEHEKFRRNVYIPSEHRYISIVRAKQLIEEQKWMEKVNQFMQNRAARVIQRAYRAYLRKYKPQLVKYSPPGKAKDTGKGRRN